MILAIDIGNTNIVIGCIDKKKTYFIERLSTVRTKTELEYAIDIKTVLDIYEIDYDAIEGGIISSVVPQITNIAKLAAEKIIKKVCEDIGLPPRIVYPFIKIGAKLYGGIDLKDGDILCAVKASTKPILIIHGDDDRFVPYHMSHEILEHCGDNAVLETFEGAGHGLSYITDEDCYKKIIEDFVSRCLGR